MVTVKDPIGITEIAELAGVEKNTAWRWTRPPDKGGEPDFPKPATVLRQGRLWAKADVEDWLERRRRRSG